MAAMRFRSKDTTIAVLFYQTKRVVTTLFALLCLSACSLYQSSGRKELERGAYNLAGLSENFETCYSHQIFRPKNPALLTTAKGFAFELDSTSTDRILVAVTPPMITPETSKFCTFQFADRQQMTSRLSSAIEFSANRGFSEPLDSTLD